MKAFSTLVLLSSVVMLCSSAPLEPVTCNSENATEAARLAMHNIDMRHIHGYKFTLLEIEDHQMTKTDTACNITLKLSLGETACHVINPKHFEDCEFSGMTDGSVTSNCTVKMTVKDSDAQVISYSCETQRGVSNPELAMICPDCPALISLTDEEGLHGALEAVKEFNKNTTNHNYYVLQEVGRVKHGNITGLDMYRLEIALVESNCSMNSTVLPSSCKALCPNRAKHAVCKSSYSKPNGVGPLHCEFYPALDTTPLVPGELEPVCEQPLSVFPAEPPAPPTNGTTGPPLDSHPPFHHCHESHEQEFHPICDWP